MVSFWALSSVLCCWEIKLFCVYLFLVRCEFFIFIWANNLKLYGFHLRTREMGPQTSLGQMTNF